MKAGESIFTQAAEASLLQMSRAERKLELQALELLTPLMSITSPDLWTLTATVTVFFWSPGKRMTSPFRNRSLVA